MVALPRGTTTGPGTHGHPPRRCESQGRPQPPATGSSRAVVEREGRIERLATSGLAKGLVPLDVDGELLGVLDLDGDGRPELWMNTPWYEGATEGALREHRRERRRLRPPGPPQHARDHDSLSGPVQYFGSPNVLVRTPIRLQTVTSRLLLGAPPHDR